MPDITFVIGGIGTGKSRLAAEWICNALASGDRMVVTSLSVFTDVAPVGYLTVGEWCAKWGAPLEDWRRRIRVLQDVNERLQFFMHYPGFDLVWIDRQVEVMQLNNSVKRQVESVPNLQARQDLMVAGKIPHGCLFVLDEVHNDFSSRAWQRIGPHVETYMSQCRKFGDDVVLITQHPEKVDANFRRNATRWVYLKNMNKTRLWGGVTFKDKFRWNSYPAEVRAGAVEVPDESGMFSLRFRDLQLCYDTTSGSGLAGTLMPKAEKPRGGHWWRWPAIGLAFIAAMFVFSHFGMRVLGFSVGHMLSSFSGGAIGAVRRVESPVLRGSSPVSVVVSNVLPVSAGFRRVAPVVEASDVHWVGVSFVGNNWSAFLSDGRVFNSGDPAVSMMVSGRYIVIDGQRISWQRSTSASASPLRASREFVPLPPGLSSAVRVGGR